MLSLNQTPTFNLKAVLQETGLKADTLRAWERRYGLPRPERTPGGHRLYSQRDVDMIKWLIARQQEGLRISQAADLWRGLEAEGQDPLQVEEFTTPRAAVSPVSRLKRDTITGLRQAWMSACLAFDEHRVEEMLALAFALYPVEPVCLELLQTGLAELGEGWYRGQVSVQQEHFASEMAMRRLETLMAATPPPARPERILIGCPPEEEHTFSALLLALLLKRRGWDVIYLGANVPAARMGEVISAVKPQLVILSAQRLPTAASMLAMGRVLEERATPLAFGGRVFNLLPELRSRIPGYFLAERLELAPPAVGEVLSSPPPLPPTRVASETYQQALAHYRERQPLIKAQIWQATTPYGIQPDHLNVANTHLELGITAALGLGDLDYLGVDLEWAAGLLSNHRLPDELLPRYLAAYRQAAKTHLDERGAPLVSYLERLSPGVEAPG